MVGVKMDIEARRKERNKQIKALIDKSKLEFFKGDYEAKDEEVLGMIIAQYFKWTDNKIVDACIEALEDANMHKEAEALINTRRR